VEKWKSGVGEEGKSGRVGEGEKGRVGEGKKYSFSLLPDIRYIPYIARCRTSFFLLPS
jgi:hypothetical protein